MNNKIDIFDFLKSITYQKNNLTNHPLFNKIYNVWMINRWLSMTDDPYCLSLANYLSTKDMSKTDHYLFLLYELPKKYVKFKYQKSKDDRKEDVEAIQKYFKVSKEKCLEILNVITEEHLEKIKSVYGGKVGK